MKPGLEILCSQSPGETRVAVVTTGGRLAEILILRNDVVATGSIYLGRVIARVPGLDAVFVDIGDRKPGFLPLPLPLPLPSPPREGDSVMVEVVQESRSEKGAKLTAAVSLASLTVVYSPYRPGVTVSRQVGETDRERLQVLGRNLAAPGEGVVLRANAAASSLESIVADLEYLRATWRTILAQAAEARAPVRLFVGADPIGELLGRLGGAVTSVLCDSQPLLVHLRNLVQRVAPMLRGVVCRHDGQSPLFERNDVESQIAQALEPTIILPSGGRLTVESTKAVIAIDVDSGAALAAGSSETSLLTVNLEAAVAIARRIRLCNISGHMVVDFIPVRRGGQERVLKALRAAVADDVVGVQVIGATPLGLVEMVRERRRPSLAEILLGPCLACSGAGLDVSPDTAALTALRAVLREAAVQRVGGLSLRAAPDVVAALDGPLRPALRETEIELGQPLALRADPALHRQQFEVFVASSFIRSDCR